jgi:hypothetical protein
MAMANPMAAGGSATVLVAEPYAIDLRSVDVNRVARIEKAL